MHRYFPLTDSDVAQMLERCGVSSLDELYADVPDMLKLNRAYDLPPEMSEKEVRDYFRRLDSANRTLTCFAGAGYYHRYSPAVVNALISRSEFLTAYTPYQPEISQGTLQYIFEYQSMMTALTGLDVSNASMYDGATATAEAVLMCVAAARKRRRVLISPTLDPRVEKVVRTYADYHGVIIDTIALIADGACADKADMEARLAAGDVAGVVVASPNRYGILEDYEGWAEAIHGAKALMVMHCHAADLGVIRTPAEWGADIACGDAQSLGMPLSYGGPYLGYLCCTRALMRKLPGRIVGATTDADGQRVFVLTLQAREQHIRRDKATSNICSNQGLMALYTAVYLSLLGADGLRELCRQGYAGAHRLLQRLEETGAAKAAFPGRPFLNEFAVDTVRPVDEIMADGLAADVLPGVKLGSHRLLIAVTEMQTPADMDKLINIIRGGEARNA